MCNYLKAGWQGSRSVPGASRKFLHFNHMCYLEQNKAQTDMQYGDGTFEGTIRVSYK